MVKCFGHVERSDDERLIKKDYMTEVRVEGEDNSADGGDEVRDLLMGKG